MIPIYFRVTRYEPAPGLPRAQPVSPVQPVTAYQPAEAVGPNSHDTERNQQHASRPLPQNPPDADSLHLLERPPPLFHPYRLEEALGRRPEPGLGSGEAYVLAVAGEHDGNESLLWACTLASLFQCRLDIVVPSDAPGQNPDLLNALRDRLQALAEDYHRAGGRGDLIRRAPLFHEVEASRLPEELDRLSLSHGASLTVLRHGRDWEESRVVSQAHCPVLVLCGNRRGARAQNVLVASDGTPSSYAAIRQGINLAQAFGAFLHIFHAQPGAKSPNTKAPHEEALAKMNWHGVEHDFEAGRGSVPEAIVAYANAHAVDLIVMGTHRARDPNRESRAESVIAAAPCPVLVVHPYKT